MLTAVKQLQTAPAVHQYAAKRLRHVSRRYRPTIVVGRRAVHEDWKPTDGVIREPEIVWAVIVRRIDTTAHVHQLLGTPTWVSLSPLKLHNEKK